MRRPPAKKPVSRTDAIIVGGGPSGLTLAACLGTAGFSVLCLERRQPSAVKTKISDPRTTALSSGSVDILKNCGLWDKLHATACPILDIRVADGRSPFHLDFHHKDVGDWPFGWIVENGIFHRALAQRVRALKTVRFITGAMRSLDTDIDEARVTLEDGRQFTASLAIGADGRNSACREAAGIPVYGWRYGQTSMVCTIAHDKPHNHVAVEHFLPGGPLATLPMTKQRSSIVWTEKTQAASVLAAMSDRDFTAALQEKVYDWLGNIRLVGPRLSYPLSLQHAERYTARRVALVGDAAHGIHPIAGQGFNLGMGDIGTLSEELGNAMRLGLDIGSASVLDAYEKRRRFPNGNMVVMTDALDRLFSNAIPPVEAARRYGLGMVQRLPPLRRFFMREAMGRGKAAPNGGNKARTAR